MLLQWLAIPLPVRLLLLTVLGLVLGALINLAIYSFVFRPRPISPWSVVPAEPRRKRRWHDRLPIIGWWFLRREASDFGRLFWIRPMLIEVFCGVGLAALYWWETVEQGVFPVPQVNPVQSILHAQFLTHALLFALLMVATFTDFDDRTIPDMITIPGTIAGMLILSQCPEAMLWEVRLGVGPRMQLQLNLQPLLALLNPQWTLGTAGLFTAWGMLLLWSFALTHKIATLRRGWIKGVQYFFVSLVRYRSWIVHLPIFFVLAAYTAWIWRSDGLHWHALFSSLMGMAVGGAVVWCVRVIGRMSFGMEVMGFGDVTLMAMIGSFLGWQAAIVTFFLAPLTAVVVAIVQWLVTRDNRIAFGPYLSLAAVLLVIFWNRLWTSWLAPLFDRPLVLAAVLIGSLPLLGLLMWLMRKLREYRE